jgi:hypothetical protein
MNQVKVPYETARPLIKDGDILLQRGNSWISRFLKISGKGVYSHAGMASWAGNSLEILQFREFQGGEALSFGSQVKKFPGQWDVFRPNDEAEVQYYKDGTINREVYKTNAKETADFFREQTGSDYGWGNIFYASLRHLSFFRLFFPAEINDFSVAKSMPYCSQAIATCWRLSNTHTLPDGQLVQIDLVPRLADWLTEPSDLSRSSVLNYLFTIEKDKSKKAKGVW